MKIDNILGGFRRRHLPINADYRPMYKIGIIVCILSKVCIANKSSLNKLHFFVWALKSNKNRANILKLLDSGETSEIISWGVEPALNKALSFCLAEELISLPTDKYVLTEKGRELFIKIESDPDLLLDEKTFLSNIGKRKVTETYIDRLTLKLMN
ncbi:MAG: hypothetical protein KGM16_11150 [Bacteroidota bacterium]|nr:hypothetical protein [Bacteroidota bacterium]